MAKSPIEMIFPPGFEHMAVRAKLRWLVAVQAKLQEMHNDPAQAANSPWKRDWWNPRNFLVVSLSGRLRDRPEFRYATPEEREADPNHWNRGAVIRDLTPAEKAIDAAAVFTPGELAAPPPPDPYENLTTFTEADTGGYFSQDATTNTFTAIPRATDAYVFKDYDADHFGDYVHDFELICTAISGTGGPPFVGVWACTSDYGSWQDMSNGQEVHIFCGGTTIKIDIDSYDKGNSNQDTWQDAPINIRYYCQAERSGTDWTCKIYTGSLGGTLKDTLSYVCQDTAWRYLLCGFSRDAVGVETITGDCQNFDINEAVVGQPARKRFGGIPFAAQNMGVW